MRIFKCIIFTKATYDACEILKMKFTIMFIVFNISLHHHCNLRVKLELPDTLIKAMESN